MFGKLFKYDAKALLRWYMIIYIVIGAATLLGILCSLLSGAVNNAMKGLADAAGNINEQNTMFGILSIAYVLLMVASGFSVVATIMAPMLGYVAAVASFYKSTLTDEGYLTFTLPAKPGTIVVSKYVSGLLFLFSGFGLTVLGLWIQSVVADYSEVIKWILEGMMEDNMFWTVITMLIVQGIWVYCELFLCVSIGGMVAKKHKLLASVGFYFLINYGTQFVSMIIMMIISIFAGIFDPESSLLFNDTAILIALSGCSLALSIGSVFITRAIFTKKLNLA